MLDTLTSALKHPVSIGTGLGALGGAGTGYFSADEDDPNRLRKALVGGATGAAIGGLTGALSVPEELERMRAFNRGFDSGLEAAASKFTSDPAVMTGALEGMDPSHRETILRYFQKGWLARMFGG